MPINSRALQHTISLVKCRSITPREGGALDYLQGELSRLGFVCKRLPFSEPGTPDVDNLYARIGQDSPHICFAGHTDVVPAGDEHGWSHPPFAGTVDNGVLFGRGTADMKGGIACFLAAVESHLQQTGGTPAGSISFLVTGDEEGPAINGTVKVLQWLEEQGERIDQCLVGEPSNNEKIGDMIKIGRRGSLNGEIVIHGKQGHVAYQHLAANPIKGLNRVIAALLDEPLDEGTESFMPSNLEFTDIEVGNRAVNVIPAKAMARFNIRFNDAHTPDSLRDLVSGKVRRALDDTPFSHDLQFSLSGESFVTGPGALPDNMAAAIRKVTGLEPELSTSGGTSDARFIKNYCPVIEFGLLNRTIHQVDEQVPLDHLETLTQIYGSFLENCFAANGK